MHHIYKITNLLSGKIYIGQTIQPNTRWYNHKYYSENPEKTGQYIHRAMNKYGINNFVFEVIAMCKTQEDANEVESLLIVQFNSKNQEYGYNLTVGGDHGGSSEETRQKLRQALLNQIATKGHPALGTKRTPEQLEHLSFAQQNRNNNYTPEMRQRMGESQKGRKHPIEHINKRVSSAQLTIKKRQEEAIKTGELKCNAPNCEVSGVDNYSFVNGIRYCSKHAQRLRRTGSLELIPFVVHNKGKTISEETRRKLLGRKPHNKIIFTDEQIKAILSDTRAAKLIAKDFNVSKNTILRVKKSIPLK